jgi:hypothetical protein
MSTLDEVCQRALQLLGDARGEQYGREMLEEAARRALEAISRFAPRIAGVELVVQTASASQALDAAGAWLVLDMEWRAEGGQLRSGYAWRVTWQNGQPVVVWLHEPYPQVGDVLRARCAFSHKLQGLDGALESTSRAVDVGLLALGASGYAAEMRAAQLTETYGSRASDLGQLSAWAEAQLKRFERLLAAEAQRAGVELPWALPQRGWSCDQWERGW